MKRIFIPFFAAAALLASCSDWTEAEQRFSAADESE